MNYADMRCPETESNCRHGDFQSSSVSRQVRVKWWIRVVEWAVCGRIREYRPPVAPDSDPDPLAALRRVTAS